MNELAHPLFVSAGAVAGALSRFYVGFWLTEWLGGTYPIATSVINFSGSFLIGGFAAFFKVHPHLPHGLWLFIGIGFLGGYTTFSTFGLDAYRLFERGDRPWGWLYSLSTVLSGILCCGISYFLGCHFF
ncbi:CrcB family protein [Candidatus Synechococcus calcipolaris G9]|uniref:Fluoride-specific ion channel FluC n=1 Tax=Candidatus Synechococcus calcipolaris G9 TaxID=1497997 RepID=A0ABT6F1X3_9SYNE|nr:CrcB family protein [Candidatus Synechococcus calcipolaris]MDG2991832.1 CrcB family protein [Candidatus Synechococcus calcipolaris G9]